MKGLSLPPSFHLWAAVDVLEGRAVRLRQGDPSRRTDYGPALEAAARWAGAGLRRLHVVDLGAALGGRSALAGFVRAFRALCPEVKIQAAGGIRSLEAALAVTEAGADRVVLGSLPFERPREARAILQRLGPGRCVAALDVREGRLRLRGWTADGGLALSEALDRVLELGFRQFLVTDIARDGEETGPNLDLYRRLSRPGVSIIASGGVRDGRDLWALAALPGVAGAVAGRALYEGRLAPASLKELGP
ncbi:MAG: HisA/HisF-related TIM barrel protein [Acidobacteriota bacterium]